MDAPLFIEYTPQHHVTSNARHNDVKFFARSIDRFISIRTVCQDCSLLSKMQAANRLQKALRTGSGLTFGAWQMLPGSNHSRAVARCGFDWMCVDTEHGNIDGELTKMCKYQCTYGLDG